MCRPLSQVLPNLRQQFARAVGFRDITVATGRMRFAVVAAQGIGSYGDNRNAFQFGIGLDATGRLVTVHKRQLDIHENKVRTLLFCCADTGLAVPGFRHLITGTAQEIAEDLPIVLLVLDHQNALAHAASTCRSTMTGSVKENVEPCPGWDSTQIRPPCISIIRFDMASPKPVPPFLRVMALSAC